MQKFKFDYWFEWGCDEDYCPCLWASDDYTKQIYNHDDSAIDIHQLPISDELIKFLCQLGIEHDKALDWEYPPNPLIWTKDEEDLFYKKSREGYKRLVEELGENYSIKYCETR